MLLSRLVVAILSIGLILLGATTGLTQDYPNKVVRIIVNAPGAGSDFVARQIAQGISGPLGQPVIVEYRGSGVLSAQYVSKAPPDGYTLFVSGSVLWVSSVLTKTPHDPVRDFSPISLLAIDLNILAVHPSLPVKSVKELIALAKARPGELNYAGSGPGSESRLKTELFKHLTGTNILYVPYKGGTAAITGLVGGEVHMAINDATLVAPLAKSGKLRALAVTSAQPSALAPGLPTVAAAGLPGFEAVGRTGMWTPAKTPTPIINRLNQEVVRLLSTAEAKERFFGANMEVVGSTPEEFAGIIKSEITILSKVIKDIGIKVE